MRNDCQFLSYFVVEVPLTICFVSSVGDSAKNAFHSNPENTVFDAKRLIGRKVDDPEVQRDQKHWQVLFVVFQQSQVAYDFTGHSKL